MTRAPGPPIGVADDRAVTTHDRAGAVRRSAGAGAQPPTGNRRHFMSSTGRLQRIALLLLMLPLELIGCGGQGAPPSAPSAVLQVSSPPNPPVVGIQGFVADSGYRVVP